MVHPLWKHKDCRCVYRRHTNFSIESIEQVFNGNPTFGQKVSATISRNGDLINHVYLQVQFPALSVGSVYGSSVSVPSSVAWTNALCHALVRYVDIEIGGQRIDRHFGLWLELWDELTQTAEKQNGLNMIGQKSNTFYTSGPCINQNVCESTLLVVC